MKPFRSVTFQLNTDKLYGDYTLVLLADLHGVEIGKENRRLLSAIRRAEPDLIFSAGDLSMRWGRESLTVAQDLLTRCREIAPVYACLGNHESGLSRDSKKWMDYKRYQKRLESKGIIILRNRCETVFLRGEAIEIDGLELPQKYYGRGILPKLTKDDIETLLKRQTGDTDRYRILLAHSPAFGNAYFDSGSDLTLCGHYHGGVFRLTKHIGAISPQMIPFPRFSVGDFYRGNQAMIVSAGLGEHSVPVRINNPRELVVIKLHGTKEQG